MRIDKEKDRDKGKDHDEVNEDREDDASSKILSEAPDDIKKSRAIFNEGGFKIGDK